MLSFNVLVLNVTSVKCRGKVRVHQTMSLEILSYFLGTDRIHTTACVISSAHLSAHLALMVYISESFLQHIISYYLFSNRSGSHPTYTRSKQTSSAFPIGNSYRIR